MLIFQEDVSFDHYFGTYPNALNPQAEPGFNAAPNTPSINGLTAALLQNNPNAANPKRLDRHTPSDVVTCDALASTLNNAFDFSHHDESN